MERVLIIEKDDDNLKDDKNAGDDKENIVDESDTAGTNDDALGSYDTVDGYILQKLLPTRKESLIFENPPAIELTSFQKRQQGGMCNCYKLIIVRP